MALAADAAACMPHEVCIAVEALAVVAAVFMSRVFVLVASSVPLEPRRTHKSVEVNGRGGVCRSFHVISFLSGVAEHRCP
jgi:hypothetical protein